MEIFNWTMELEKIFNDLIEGAKEENLGEIQTLRNNQEKMFEFALKQKQDITRTALDNLHSEVNDRIEKFRNQLNTIMKNIEGQFQKDKDNLIVLIINNFGLEF